MRYSYRPMGVCSQEISFDLNDNIVTNIKFIRGCPGNLLAISKILEGQTVEFIVERLEGNLCSGKNTSCADQLAKAVKLAYESQKIS